MKLRLILVFALFALANTTKAQLMKVEQMEAKWRVAYMNGCQEFNAQHYTDALRDFGAAIELLQKNDAVGTRYYIYALIKLAETYHATNDEQNLNKTTQEILGLKSNMRPGSKNYIDYLYNLGIYYSNIGQYEQGLKVLEEAESYQDALAQMPEMPSKIKHRKALCLYCMNDCNKAVENEELAVKFDQDKRTDYTESLLYYLYKVGDWKKIEESLPTSFDNAREPILRMFAQSKNDDRAAYWSIHGLFFSAYLPFYALSHSSSTLAGYAYDAALLSKGVLLAAQNKSNEITIKNENPEFLASYNRYKELKAKKEKTLDEEFEMQALSDVFLRYQKEHKNEFREDFRIRWADVKNVLTDDDVAIEFQTAHTDTSKTEYFAITLKKSYSSPKVVQLCSMEDIMRLPSEKWYNSSALYNLIWKPLENEVANSKNIYFSPSGFIHNTGIEYLPNEDGENINNLHNVCRLSSTKELVVRNREKLKKAVLFGGVNYDTKLSSLASQSTEYANVSTMRSADLDSLDIRATQTSGGVAYLPGTMEEIEEVSTICEESAVSTTIYCGDDGSEYSFYNLSGSDADIVHIATHGFYYADKNIGRQIQLDKLYRDTNLHFSSDDIVIVNEDKMLTRSGLLMAGANNFLKRIKIPHGIQDGVLYAVEISNVNLNHVKLLVLSACQSGLGDIVASEGVFGLQRGFKLAGVKSIIMSLWKVDDTATKILMTEMYKQLKTTPSIREALTNAQLYLRTIENGKYDDPKYWAAFILIDDI